MSRYRPPQKRGAPYITADGFANLEAESKALWTRRAHVTKALAAAAAEGDRSENAEYIYRKKELREIDRRIRYLQTRMPTLKIVDTTPDDQEKVFFGAWVALEDEQGREIEHRIVGSDEAKPEAGLVSVDSPLAKALLKRGLDDQVTVRSPSGEQRYVIVAIRY